MKNVFINSVLVVFALLVASCGRQPEAKVEVMSFNIRFNNPNDSLDTAWDRRREPCTRMMAQYRPDVVGMQEPRNSMT